MGEAMFPTVEAVAMAIITMEASTTTTEDSTIIMEDSTTTTADSTIITEFTTTTTGDSAMVVRVKVRATDASVSTASHSVTGMGMCMALARGETVVGEHGATQPDGTTGLVRT